MISQSKPYLMSRNFFKKIYHRFKKPKTTRFPEIISIELSTICNAKCKFCPHSQIMEKDPSRAINMKKEVFEKIIDQCVGKQELKLIKPSLYGEPAITPKLFERLEYIRKKLPRVSIKIISNGVAMTKEKTDTLLEQRLIDEINFSLDANNKKTFEDFKEISWEKVIDNINYFIMRNRRTGRKVKVALSFVCTPENKDQLEGFKKRWAGKADEFHIGTESGLKRRKALLNKKTSLPCLQIFNRLNLLTDGRAVLCCLDAFADLVVGDVNKQSLMEIWHGEKFSRIRKLHLMGQKDKIPLCSICEEWY